MEDFTADKNPREETGRKSSQSGSLRVTISLFVLYAFFLVGLTLTTANPVLINPRQIENSNLVFVGKVLKTEDSTVEFEVQKLLKGTWDRDTILVRGFQPEQVSEGEKWVVPAIFISAETTQITPLSSYANAKPSRLIYPSDTKTLDNLKSRLSSGENSP